MASNRINRISEEVKKVVSVLIMNDIKDPRVSTMTSVTEVQVTRDLRYANIYVSVLGDKKTAEETIKGLESAKGFIRKEIGRSVNLRVTPEPMFFLDTSIEYGAKISKMLFDLKKPDNKESK